MPRTTGTSFFLDALTGACVTHDLRESAAVFVTHALKVNQNACDAASPIAASGQNNRRWPLLAALALALLVGFITSGASTLYCQYSYACTLGQNPTAPLNAYVTNGLVKSVVFDPSMRYTSPNSVTPEQHNHLAHVALGAAIVVALSTLRLRYVGWPLHPVGFLLVYSYAMDTIWFSLLVGSIAQADAVAPGRCPGIYRRPPPFLLV